MIEAKGKLLNWGNSVGIRLNKSHLTGTPLDLNDDVEIKIKKSYTKGKLKKLVDTDKSLKEIDSLLVSFYRIIWV